MLLFFCIRLLIEVVLLNYILLTIIFAHKCAVLFGQTMIVVLEVRTNIKRAKTFLCGGFRAADQMWEAIYEGWTDGIMVARPLAAEPGDNDSYFEDWFYEPLIRSQDL